MHAVVGVDTEGSYRSGLELFSKIGFPDSHVEFVHVDDILLVGGAASGGYAYAGYGKIDEERRLEGERLLSDAVAKAAAIDIPATSFYAIGDACDYLKLRADETRADLVVVGSTAKSRYGAFVWGSVGRGLAIGAHQSVLVAKHPPTNDGPLTVVFATDGSEYADGCLRMFVRMRPKGIGRLVVVTAVDHLESGVPPPAIKQHVDSLVSHLKEEGYNVDGHVVEGNPTEVIDAMMTSVGADLLALGAEGHGFFERLFLGSVALSEVVATPYSVLLLRSG